MAAVDDSRMKHVEHGENNNDKLPDIGLNVPGNNLPPHFYHHHHHTKKIFIKKKNKKRVLQKHTSLSRKINE
jgi:hypothetical protein